MNIRIKANNVEQGVIVDVNNIPLMATNQRTGTLRAFCSLKDGSLSYLSNRQIVTSAYEKEYRL